MYFFINDYNDICNVELLDALKKAIDEKNIGYGFDEHSKKARQIIKGILKDDDVDIFFISGGTLVNILGATQGLRMQDSIIAPSSGHINVHEAGAIEATGTRIETIDTENGKLTGKLIENYIKNFDVEYTTVPKLVYISNSTELGTIYKKQELEEIYDMCKKHNLYLYIDGARMSHALASKYNDIDYSDLTSLSDIFTLGGTKNGLPLGEVLVVKNKDLRKNMINLIKQKGALMAKSFINGILFEEIFASGIYFENAKIAFEMAEKINDGLVKLNIPLAYEFNSNQIFIKLSAEDTMKLRKNVAFEISKEESEYNVIRLVTTYRTTEQDVEGLLREIRKL